MLEKKGSFVCGFREMWPVFQSPGGNVGSCGRKTGAKVMSSVGYRPWSIVMYLNEVSPTRKR